MLSPIIFGAVVAAGLALALLLLLYLFCTLKVEVRVAERRLRPPAPSDLDEWKRRLEDVEARLAAPGPRASAPQCAPAEASTVPVRPGMNLSRRSQPLRLARRGEPPEQIASRLGLATGEVRLLLKIHGILMQQAVRGPHPCEELKPDTESADISSSALKAASRAVKSI